MENHKNRDDVCYNSGLVHITLYQSYTFFLMAVILGLVFHMVFDVNILSPKYNQLVGLIMIILGSVLIFWAQKSSKPSRSQTAQPVDDSYFTRGPYKYNRNPTHVGLTTMTYGLAFMVNSFATVIFVFLAYVITKVFFITKEEKLLEKRYGEIYLKYKKRVRSWI